MTDTTILGKLLEYYSQQGRTLSSVEHLCGRKRKTLIKHCRSRDISFPDLRKPNKKVKPE